MEARNETLNCMYPPINATHGAGVWGDTFGYIDFGPDALLFQTSIDLAGWAMEDFTFGLVKTAYQDPGIYASNAASNKLEIMEIISSIPIDDSGLSFIRDNMGITCPGMIHSQQDFTAIIHGAYKLYTPNASLAAFPDYLQLVNGGTFGSSEPTASSELYCYRIVKCAGVAGETLVTPACRIGLYGAMFKEPDTEYLMRLKRSYELQQLVD